MPKTKHNFKLLLQRLGVLKKPGNKIIDLRDRCNDPRVANYYPKTILIDAPTTSGRKFFFFPLKKESDPFVRALHKYLNETGLSNKHTLIEQELTCYYESVQPKNAFEWLDLEDDETSDVFKKNEPWTIPLPWSPIKLEDNIKNINRWVRKDNNIGGFDLTISHGFTYFGPVSPKKISIEVTRLLDLLISIQKNGYVRNDTREGDIGATILINESGDWRWLAGPGQHRAAVLAALGYKHIPVRVRYLIYRNESKLWPNVLSGLYTEKQALRVFDKVFLGQHPTWEASSAV
jgi:hypothetical protein